MSDDYVFHTARLAVAAGRPRMPRPLVLATVSSNWIDVCSVLGFAELTAGDAASAAAWLAPATDALIRRGDRSHPALRDAVHAAVETGDIDTARRLAGHLAGAAAVHARALLGAAKATWMPRGPARVRRAPPNARPIPFESAR
jgi:hypothetical protein